MVSERFSDIYRASYINTDSNAIDKEVAFSAKRAQARGLDGFVQVVVVVRVLLLPPRCAPSSRRSRRAATTPMSSY